MCGGNLECLVLHEGLVSMARPPDLAQVADLLVTPGIL